MAMAPAAGGAHWAPPRASAPLARALHLPSPPALLPPRRAKAPTQPCRCFTTPERPAPAPAQQQQQQEHHSGRAQQLRPQQQQPAARVLPPFRPAARLSPKPALHQHPSLRSPAPVDASSAPSSLTQQPDQPAVANVTPQAQPALEELQAPPLRGWRRLLQLLIVQVGRALQAIALAFCFLALLLLRPRAAGATPGVTPASSPAAALLAHERHAAPATRAAQHAAGDQASAAAPAARRRHVAVASLGLQPWLSAPATSSSRAPAPRTTRQHQPAPADSDATPPTSAAPAAAAAPSQQREQQQGHAASSVPPSASASASTALPTDDFQQQQQQQQPQDGPQAGGGSAPHPHPHAPHHPPHHTVVLLQGAALLAAHEAAVQALFRATAASVVNISAARAAGSFSSLDVTRLSGGQGSGFIWDERGHVVTCFSCVRGAAEVKVTFADASSYTAKLVGADPSKNLAVLRLSMPKAKLKELVPVKLNLPGATTGPGASVPGAGAAQGASAGAAQAAAGGAGVAGAAGGVTVSPQLQQLLAQGGTAGAAAAAAAPQPVLVGSSVWAVGAATGLQHTLTQGLVSGLGCELPGAGPYPPKGLIQVDAPCAHQAGGVLVNSQGRVVGMLLSPGYSAGGAAGAGGAALGYALPVEALRGLVGQILALGKPSRPTLGVTLAPPQVLAAQSVEGVLVLEVPPGSPAAAAGLRHTHRDIFGDVILGDVIVGLEGGPVRSAGDLYAALDARKAGERVRLDVLRDGKATSLTLVLGERGLTGSLEE